MHAAGELSHAEVRLDQKLEMLVICALFWAARLFLEDMIEKLATGFLTSIKRMVGFCRSGKDARHSNSC